MLHGKESRVIFTITWLEKSQVLHLSKANVKFSLKRGHEYLRPEVFIVSLSLSSPTETKVEAVFTVTQNHFGC